jgi:hypothetical protein
MLADGAATSSGGGYWKAEVCRVEILEPGHVVGCQRRFG